jgi:hypothetical protein
VVPIRSFALDISPLLQSRLGAVFPQAGIIAKAQATGNGASVALAASGTAVGGSYSVVHALSDGGVNDSIVLVPTPTPSPISNSNLLFLREDDRGADTIPEALLSVLGVFV